MKKIAAILLAAGQGTRMKSSLPKVLHEIAGAPLMTYPLEVAKNLKCHPIVVVVGYQADLIQEKIEAISSVKWAIQKEQLGSAHAVLSSEKALKGFKGELIIFSGDVPLIQKETLSKMLNFHRSEKNDLTLGTLRPDNPIGYGRVFRNKTNEVEKVVEETDLDDQEKKIREVNGGLYIVNASLLFKALKKVRKNPVKKEYYLTDIVKIFNQDDLKVGGFLIENSTELLGVNTKLDLSIAEKRMQQRIHEKWMLEGVTFLAPERTRIEKEVIIGSDTVIHSEVSLIGKTKIGKECVIEQGAILKNAVIGDRVVIKAYSYLEESLVGLDSVIGPFARLRPESILGKNVKVGNFVELKKTQMGDKSKANHLSYIGDAIIGKEVNIGAGTITCNYDGVKKYQTKIEDGAFIGSDTQFVAPVKIGKKAYIGAGTTVTQDVPAGALAISRTAQKNILRYKKKG